ncbi:MAG TPA: glycosyltransferase family 39 protein [Candidatus Sulfotelmatobacter sp.]|nr:glycosyltransferase family 39 protein [Candidatus Sulfotelmatobacter sp.]
MALPQNLVHQLEEGGGKRFLHLALAVVGLLLLLFGYNWRAFHNMSNQEAMDAAQLGRNIAQGKGFTTSFIRPFSIYLLKQHNPASLNLAEQGKNPDPARLKGPHPDLANPPVYPVVLAGLMKLKPLFSYPINTTSPWWSNDGRFWRYEPDFLIALFNQLLFLGVVVLVFFLARRLFEPAVAWLSALLLLGTELFWRFSVSGLSTMLLLLIFVGLVWGLTLLEQEARAPKRGPAALLVLAGLLGFLVGLGALTRYAFAGLILPVLLFILLFTGRQRVQLALLSLAVFAAVLTPWIIRNLVLSGTPFGTATYTALENTFLFPEYSLQRSLGPEFKGRILTAIWYKFIGNSRQIFQTDLPKLGGNWLSAFFLVGLLIPFRNPSLQRLRYFLLGSLAVLCVFQALGKTQLSEDSPEINSENLLVLVAPLVLVFGVSLFYLLLEQLQLPFLQLRYLIISLFGLIVSLPLVFTFLPPKGSPVAYPPYYPPFVQLIGSWLRPDELSMSDIPWAMAWYGQRQSLWLTANAQADFFAIHDYCKPVSLLYLTPVTTDRRFYSQMGPTGDSSWGSFVVETLVRNQIPPDFPLHKAQGMWLKMGQIVLADWERWNRPPKGAGD